MTSMPDPDPAAHPEESRGHSARERALASRVLIAVGGGYLVAQLVLFSFRPPGWDESIYLSQVMPGTKAMFFGAHHARGITLLVAPVTWLGGSVGAVRPFLMGASAVAMVATFWLWIPLVGMAAPVAAFIFSFSWLGLLHGSEVMPNFWAAILGLAVAGLVARRVEGVGTRHVMLAFALLAAMALFRPTEATVLAGAIGVYILLFRRAHWRTLVPLGLGLFLGWLPWAIEMSIRFGGPVKALREAGTAHFTAVPVARKVAQYLAFTDGRLSPSAAPDVPLAGVVWWAAFIVMAIVALARGVTATDRAASLLSCFVALALAAEYLVFVSAQAARFLLPAYAFASLPVAIGLVSLLRGRIVSRAAGAIVLIVLIPWAIWQGAVADRVEAQMASSSVSFREIALTIRELADGRPCAFLSPHNYPEIQLASGCDGAALGRGTPSTEELTQLLNSGKQVFVCLRKPAPRASPLSSLTPVLAPAPRGKTWFIYRVPESIRETISATTGGRPARTRPAG